MAPPHTVDFSKFGLLGYGFKYFIRSQELERSEFLNDDCFTVRVDVHIFKQAPAPPMALVPPSDMHRHLGGLLSSKVGADIEFLVGGETFVAHRLVLRARSPVFKAGGRRHQYCRHRDRRHGGTGV
jgi:speckle-type POZ protein